MRFISAKSFGSSATDKSCEKDLVFGCTCHKSCIIDDCLKPCFLNDEREKTVIGLKFKHIVKVVVLTILCSFLDFVFLKLFPFL